jgi:tripartite-type tricarboxylate transporter receptor subunit TctC
MPHPDMPRFVRSLVRPLSLALFAFMALAGPQAQAADCGDKPIRLVVPFGAGGTADVLGRLLAERMGANMKRSIIVDNRVGVGGSIGATEVARSTPDGCTLLLATSSTHGINPAVYHNLKYDALKDFAPITLVAISDYALVVPANSPYRTLPELLKAKEQLRYASSGNGTTSHLASAMLALRTQSNTTANWTHVPYKSSPPAMQDVMGGQVDFLIDNTSTAVPLRTAGRVRILATTGATRDAATPDVPTIAESGVPGYEVLGWWALLAPAGTPPAVVQKLHDEAARVLTEPTVKAKLVEAGNPPDPRSPEATRDYIASELKNFKAVVDKIGLKID